LSKQDDRDCAMTSQETYSDLEERDLVEAVQRGNTAAFRTIYALHRDSVYNLVSYSLNDPRLIEDVLQIVFMKIYRGLAGFRFEASLSTWIYRVTINECQNQNRANRTRLISFETIVDSGEEIDTASIPEDLHAQKEKQEIIQHAVMQLTPKLRAVVVLRYVEGLSYEEIADVLECAPGTVASRLNRALQMLEFRLRPLKSAF
jgi:RNA polymerase sigma-70 factor (ECF subfamily)